MKEFLKFIDNMGRSFKFSIQDGKFKTPVGGLITIFQGLSFLALVWFNGQDLYKKQEPFLESRNLMKSTYPILNMTRKNLNFAYRLENYDGETIYDLSAFYLIMKYQLSKKINGKFEKDNSVSFEKMLERCTSKHFKNSTLHSYNLFNYFCTDINFPVGGSWGEDIIYLPTFYVKICDIFIENTYNITCKSKKEVYNLYPELYVSYFYQKNMVDPNDFNDPINDTYTYYYQSINLNYNLSSNDVINYSSAEMITDSGILFPSLSTLKFIELESKTTYLSDGEKEGKVLHCLDFYITRSFRSYYRHYIKLSEVFASVGGIFNIFMIFTNFAYSFFYRDVVYLKYLQDTLLKLNHEVLDDTKEFEILNNNFNNVENVHNDKIGVKIEKDTGLSMYDTNILPIDNKIYKKPTSLSRKYKLKSIGELNKKDIVLNNDIFKIIDYMNMKIEEVQLNLGEFYNFKFFRCCYEGKNISKFNLYEASKKEINKKIDIEDLLKVKDQFKLLQKIILNENQCYMLKKRELHRIIDSKIINSQQEKDLNEEKNKTSEDKLIEYLKSRKLSDSLSQTDNLLYGYLEEEMKDKIKQVVNI